MCLDSLIYSPGSLYTSIIPCLALRGVGEAIATSTSLCARILFCNSTLDRETPNYTALRFVEAIRSACSASYGEDGGLAQTWDTRQLVSHVVYIEQGEVQVEVGALQVRSWSLFVGSVADPHSFAGPRHHLHSHFSAEWPFRRARS